MRYIKQLNCFKILPQYYGPKHIHGQNNVLFIYQGFCCAKCASVLLDLLQKHGAPHAVYKTLL